MFGGIPFGFGGGFGGPSGPSEDADTTSLYEALGVAKDADQSTIRKAYMRLAKKEHPDKGGDPEKFKKISKAYEILGDAEKRKLYDAGGEEAVEHGGSGGGASMFSDLFGGGRRSGPAKGEDIVHALKISLEDLYKGRVMKLKVTRDVICTDCTGSGCKAGASEASCSDCEGRGMRVQIRRVGPMIQQMSSPCPTCRGQGKSVRDEDRCPGCAGKKVKSEKKLLEVAIEKGMKHNEKIIFRGQADEAPGKEPGDIVFVVQETNHERFQRKGCDLVMEKDITLLEALTGTRFVVDHLDGRQVLIQTEPGEVLSHGELKSAVGCGMPVRGNPFSKGDLFIKFNVQFPKPGSLNPAAIEALSAVLPGPKDPMPAVDEDVEEVTLTEVDIEAVKARARAQRDAYEDSDDEGAGRRGQAVQCAQQ